MSAFSQVFIGTYTEPILFGTGKVLHGKGKGIYSYRMNTDTGSLEYLSLIPGVKNPSYLHVTPDKKTLFCVHEQKTPDKKSGGEVSSFSISREKQDYKFLNTQPTFGADPCHITLDCTGRFLFTANFMSGSVSVHPVNPDGRLGEASDFRQHYGSSIDPVRQSSPHAHAVTVSMDNRFVFVPDLGLDAVAVYEFDDKRGTLAPREDLTVKETPGAGPRHIIFHPDGRNAFLINELDCTISSYRYDPDTGQLSAAGTISTLPESYEGENTCAHLQITPCGTYIYGSNRGHDTIAAFEFDPVSQALKPVGHFPTMGKNPRFFTVDPSGRFLLAANQDSDSIVVFAINKDTGKLFFTGLEIFVPTPVCIVIIP